MDAKKDMLTRTYIVLLLVTVVALAVFVRAFQLQVFEGEKWRAKGREMYIALRPVEAQRGNIYDVNGSLLATSLPYYSIYWDATVVPMDTFSRYVDELASLLGSEIDNEYTVGAWVQRLYDAKVSNNRYFLIKRHASYPQMTRIQSYPVFRMGKYKGGLIIEQQNKRQYPFRLLAYRTIGRYEVVEEKLANGSLNTDTLRIGLEGYYNKYLSGQQGQRLMEKINNQTWVPVHDVSDIEPKAGRDVVTTIDINLQDIVESALMKAMKQYEAKYGCAVLMEVKTGAIRAIANIGKMESGDYWEDYNHAIAKSTEPGSTFKLASIMALLEDGYVDLDDTIDLEYGKHKFFDATMEDAVDHGLTKTTVRHAFEISSNVGIAKLIHEHYNKNGKEKRFLNHLHDFRISTRTGIELDGEGDPFVKSNDAADWSGISLPWMSTGYEVSLTPIQLLSFYNAVANQGNYMKPYLVEEIREYGQPIKKFKPTVLKRRIASKSTLKQVTELLVGVVKNGTAKAIYTDKYQLAGKTGTAVTNTEDFRKGKDFKRYQASFAGFFPADKPMYSCVVMLYDPKSGIYGGTVCAPVFREIADKTYALSFDAHPNLASRKIAWGEALMPNLQAGYKSEMLRILNLLKYRVEDESKTSWAVATSENDTVKLAQRNIQDKVVPNVLGMGLRDAIFLLENKGLRVRTVGVGKVKSQSVKPGQSTRGIRNVTLVLG